MRSVFVFALWLAFAAAPALAAPCTTSTPACTEWITPGSASVRLLVYRSFPLDVKNADITRAVVLVHGAGRDADNYFQHVLAAAFLGGALDNTVVISPRFASTNNGCADKVADREAAWECGGPARWTSGGDAVGTPGVTSFDAMDAILTRLAKRDAFPNLRSIVLAGHSAGGQFVSRYEMTNQVHDKLGVPLTYIVANPSSYAYLDSTRPSASTIAANVAALAPGYHPAPPAKPLPAFVPFGDADDCTTYDTWPYGMQKRVGLLGAADRRSAEEAAGVPSGDLSARRPGHPAAVRVRRIVRGDGAGTDHEWPAGWPTRATSTSGGAKHEVREVPSCGHNARCMFTDGAALALLFPKP